MVYMGSTQGRQRHKEGKFEFASDERFERVWQV